MYEVSEELADTDHFLVVSKFGEKLAVNIRADRILMGKDLISGN